MALVGRRKMLAVGATLVAGCMARNSARAEEGGFRPLTDIVPQQPAAAPKLSFTALDGSHVDLAAFRGKPVVLNFWATWCGPCVAELPELDRLAAGGAFTVLAVSADRTGAARVAPFLQAHPLSHATVLLDPGSDAVHAVDVAGFPTTLLIDAAGQVRGRLEGPAAWSSAAPTIARILRGTPPG